MLTLCMLRGLFAVALAVLWLFVPGSGTAQEILKELEKGEHQHGDDHAGHNHGHDPVPGMEKTSTEPKEHRGQQCRRISRERPHGHKQATDHAAHGQMNNAYSAQRESARE